MRPLTRPSLLVVALLIAPGCSLLFDGHDLHGKGDGGDGDMGIGEELGSDDLAGDHLADDLAGSGDLGGGGDLAHRLTMSFAETASSPVAVGHAPYALRVGDFDGDGHLDVVTVNNTSADLSFLFGDGQGGFTAALNLVIPQPGSTGTACSGYALTVGNFDGVGAVDVAATCTDQNTVNGGGVFLSNGNRTFTLKAITGLQSTARYQPQSIAAGDYDHDGKLDLAIGAYTQPGSVMIFKGNGGGTFATSPTKTFSVTGSITSVATGDFNGDGRDDLVASNGLGNVTVFLQAPANNTLAAGVDYNAWSGSTGAHVVDLNHDGHLDIQTCDQSE